jgi:tetratricopeptide (TPR) repeat protein
MKQTRKSSRSALAFLVVVSFAGWAAKARAEPVAVHTALAPTAENDTDDIRARIPQTIAEWARGAMLFDGLGDFHRRATTSSAEAQKFFDQGMRFLWAFNHDESTRSFAKAAELDPSCAICYWGVVLTVGPNYNLPMMAEQRAKVAWEALGQAEKYSSQASPAEQALISALSKRYNGPKVLDSLNEMPLFIAYANAMKAVSQKFPNDFDVQTLYAEAMMNLHAWKLWTPDGHPAPGTTEILATLESVLKRDPWHPGANHYYIHAVEASPDPGRGIAAAERLRGLMPASGHLEHMPAHIMQRVGRYEEASEANRKGIAADLAYLAKTKPLDYYNLVYTAHNYQFLAFSAAMEGRSEEALEAARRAREFVTDDLIATMPGMDWPFSEVYSVLVRFGRWDEMIAEPPPNPRFKALTGGYLYAKATALAAKGRVAEAKATVDDLEKLAGELPADAAAGFNTAKDVLAVGVLVAKARIAGAQNEPEEAINLLRQAVAKEDQLAYDEPADWFFPVRHLLGAELLKVGRANEAEAVYRADLRRHPANGWALAGLSAALEVEQKSRAAAKAKAQMESAWKSADVKLVSSAF